MTDAARPVSGASATSTEDPFHTPLATPLATPRPGFLGINPSLPGTPRDSAAVPETDTASAAARSDAAIPIAPSSEKPIGASGSPARRPFWRRPIVWLAAIAAVVILVLAIVLPVTLVNNSHNSVSGASGGSGSEGGSGSGSSGIGGGSGGSGENGATSGGNGSVITLADGTKATYVNNFGGFWVDDPKDPFSGAARPNSWTPPLNTSWAWGTDRIYGVNLGGWFVLEPFIAPNVFQNYSGAVDEWTLSQMIAADPKSGGLQAVLEHHYSTFITEEDFIQIAGAGLNWVRIPIPFWAIETWEGEPFLPRVCWKYILQAFAWARKYGLRIYLDLHTAPGSQNGYNHSGKLGQVNFLNGLMGYANAQRMLSYIREITEFISQPEYKDVIPLFGIVNEVLVNTIGFDVVESFYVEAMDMIRTNITGLGAGNGPFIAIHDGFIGVSKWADFMPGSDRLVLDTHPYFAFDGQSNDAPLAVPEVGGLTTDGASGGTWPRQACSTWQKSINDSQSAFGITVAGEMSNGVNNCGLFVNGVGNGASFNGGDCTVFDDWASWNASMKSGLEEFLLASMDATQNWFFWTWKIGNSSAGTVQAPLWSYKLGLDNGWVPTDPRRSVGKCAALVNGEASAPAPTYSYAASQTGNPAPSPPPAALAAANPWPPTTISNLPPAAQYPALIPTYTPTGPVSTLPMPSVTSGVKEGSGWENAADSGGAFTAVAGCSYPNAWDSADAVAPTAVCTGAGSQARRRWEARPTPPSGR